MTKKKDAYDKFAGEFKPIDELEEELEEEDIDVKRAEEEHFEAEKE
jgi:hypothetical protein